jgi:hypothetical protein
MGAPVVAAPRGGASSAKVKRAKPKTVREVYARWLEAVVDAAGVAWDKAPWRWQAGSVVAFLAFYLWCCSKVPVLLFLLVVLAFVGFAVWHQRHRADLATRGGSRRPGLTGRLYPHRLFCRAWLRVNVLALVALSGWLPVWGEVWPVSLVATLLIGWVVWKELPDGDEPEDEWYTHDNLVADVFHASVLGPWREEWLPRLRYLGPVRHDEFGTTALVALPGISWEALSAKHASFAARLGVSRRLLVIAHGGRDDDGVPYGENVVRLWVGTRRKATSTTSPVATATRTNWRQAVRIGVDTRGRTVRALTVDVHSLLVAKTRAGKTWLARIIVGHAALDPSVDLWVLNGKDKRGDWRPLAPLCERYVGVDDEDSLAAAFDALDDLHALCRERKDAHASNLTPVVVLLEEWFSIRELARAIGTKGAKATDEAPAVRDTTVAALDASAARLGSVASGYGVHIIALAQRGTGDYVAMGLKANLTQRMLGMVSDAREAGWTIGTTPDDLPSMAGEFLVQQDEDAPTLTQCDAMTDDEWEALCARALVLREAEGRLPHQRTCASPDALEDVVAASTPEHVVEVPAVTLEGCALALLDEHGHLSSSEMLGLLPAAVAPRTREVLGRRLGEMHGVEQGYVGSKRGWRRTGGAPAAKVSDLQQRGSFARSQGTVEPSAAVLAVQP